MTKSEIIKEIEYLEAKTVKADKYFNELPPDVVSEKINEYTILKNMLYRLNALNRSALD